MPVPTRKDLDPYPFWKRLNNLMWELRLGISTRGIVDVDHADSYHYATMSYPTINTMLRFLALQESDVLIDIGSGKGRILCCAARHPVRKVIGVDLSKQFCDKAGANAQNLRGRQSTIHIHNGIAQDFDYREGTVFTLFNPFGATTLSDVLTKIRSDISHNPHPIRIAYANPVHEEVFRRHSWLERYEHWDKAAGTVDHSISFYRSI